jgi:hypothetical protein
MKFFKMLCAVLCISGSIAQAQQVGDVTLWSGLSTFGATVEGGYQFAPEFRLRGGWMGGVNVNDTQTEDGVTYDVEASIGALTMVLDYSPIDADWRVSGGILLSRTAIDTVVTGTVENPLEYNGQTFDGGAATGRAEFMRSSAPIVTMGYDYSYSDDWIISGEIGGVFIGGLDLTITGDSAALQDAIDSDADVRASREEAADFTLYPYISLSVGYQF